MSNVSPNVSGLRPLPSVQENTRAAKTGGVADAGFRDQLAALKNAAGAAQAEKTVGSRLKFSNHAVDRMQARGISFSPEQMAKIESAVSKAAGKGAKDTLLLTDTSALIVSVKDNTVVTVMDKGALKENVFTNIDSAVMI